MANSRLTWHPQFSLYYVEQWGGLFWGENKQFFIDKREFEAIAAVVDNNGRTSDYVFQTKDVAEQVKRLEHIDQLFSDGVIAEKEKQQPFYITPNFSKKIRKVPTLERCVYFLTDFFDSDTVIAWLATISLPISVAVVFVDDYLDPRLVEINKVFKEKGIDWVILKPTGQTPQVGPYISRTQEPAPCYQCLLSRLVQNNPVREWHRRQIGHSSHSPVPILSDENTVIAALDSFKKNYFEKLLNTNLLYVIDTHSNESTFHTVFKRPQCSVCGDPQLFGVRNNAPIVLQDNQKYEDADGGYRELSRNQTIVNIHNLISPITGIVSELKNIAQPTKADIDTSVRPESLPETESGGMQVYRAAYFQNTYRKEKVTADTFVQLSLGKGVSDTQARCSALGETLERQAAQYTGEEILNYAVAADLEYRAFPPHQLAPFSERQYSSFSKQTRAGLSSPQWVVKHQAEKPIRWARGWSLSEGEHVYVPAAFCFANTPFEDHIYSLYTHNGNAAGNTKEEAILQGALELIERDAAAIWWYNQIPRPEICLEIIPEKTLNRITKILDRQWHYWVLDLSNDIHVVSCVAVGQHKVTGKFVLGFGSHLEASIACQRALTEMYQLIIIKDKITGPFDFDRIPPHPSLFPKRNTMKETRADFALYGDMTIKAAIVSVVEALKITGLELCVINYSRPDIPLNTLKVIAPGLCHFWPQLGNRRLYDTPVKLGWLSRSLQENELNPLALYL